MFYPENYTLIASILPRLLGIIYFFAFGAFIFQMRGLFSVQGILPIADFLAYLRVYYPRRKFFVCPSLFWINSSYTSLIGLVVLGTFLSIVLMLGFYPSLMLFFLYILYLSLASAGQDFLGFGWEGYLLEITIQVFLISLTQVPNPLVWVSINFLLFRFYFQAGIVKLQSGDRSWRNLTAVAYHYLTQPIPNTVAWYVYKLPLWFQKASCFFMFVVELVVPFGIFFNEEIRFVTFFLLFSLQFFIWATGNFSFLNHLAVVFSCLLVNNHYISAVFPIHSPPATATAPLGVEIFLYCAGGVILFLQIVQLVHHYMPNRTFAKLLHYQAPFHLVNRYGIFAIMTVKRYEIIVEGSMDGQQWKEYLFYWKPSETQRRPRRVSPYQPRIDWQAWFLPFEPFEQVNWFQHFLTRLLQGSKPVLSLLRYNPFPDAPPKYVRALVYDYEFSDFATKKKTGQWWTRRVMGPYSPTMMLKERQISREDSRQMDL